MKTIKFLFTATAAAMVTFATAVEKPKMNVTPLSADMAVVSITNENAAYFEVSIETPEGNVVYYKQSNTPLTNYRKTFDFANLENGNYVFNLKVNDTKLSKDFKVNSQNISFGDEKLRFDPYFSFNNNVLKFSYLNFDEENFSVSIYDNSDLIFEKRIGKEFAINDGYNISKLEAGNYKLVLASRSKEYIYDFSK